MTAKEIKEVVELFMKLSEEQRKQAIIEAKKIIAERMKQDDN